MQVTVIVGVEVETRVVRDEVKDLVGERRTRSGCRRKSKESFKGAEGFEGANPTVQCLPYMELYFMGPHKVFTL